MKSLLFIYSLQVHCTHTERILQAETESFIFVTLLSFITGLCTQARKLTNAELTKKRNALFGREKARQTSLVSRVEKIEVDHVGPPENCRLLMNKNLSTPFNCAMRKNSDSLNICIYVIGIYVLYVVNV